MLQIMYLQVCHGKRLGFPLVQILIQKNDRGAIWLYAWDIAANSFQRRTWFCSNPSLWTSITNLDYSPRTGRHNFFHLGCQKIFHCLVRTSKKSYFITSSEWNVVLDSDRQKERKKWSNKNLIVCLQGIRSSITCFSGWGKKHLIARFEWLRK